MSRYCRAVRRAAAWLAVATAVMGTRCLVGPLVLSGLVLQLPQLVLGWLGAACFAGLVLGWMSWAIPPRVTRIFIASASEVLAVVASVLLSQIRPDTIVSIAQSNGVLALAVAVSFGLGGFYSRTAEVASGGGGRSAWIIAALSSAVALAGPTLPPAACIGLAVVALVVYVIPV